MKRYRLLVVIAALAATFTACSGQNRAKKVEANATKSSVSVNKGQTNNKTKGEKDMKVVEMTTQMFKDKVMDYEANPQEWKYKGSRPAIIDFYATWCGPCKATAPTVEKIAEEYDGKIDVYKVDVDKQEELAAVFGIQSIPTVLFIPTTGTPAKSVGAMGYEQFKDAIKNVLLK